MKYLRKFNEELRTSTYRRAARELLKQSPFNKDRADNLNKWADQKDLAEGMIKWEEMKENFAKFGTINIKITVPSIFTKDTIIRPKTDFIGRFHLFINFDRDAFADEFDNNKEQDDFDMPLTFFIGAIPADQETLDNCLNYMPENDFGNGFFWTNVLSILMIFEDGEIKIHDVKIEEYDNSLTGEVNIVDRAGAQTIKRILHKMFSDPNYGYPSGYTDFDSFYKMFDAKILAECGLFSDYALSMDKISDFINSISANKLIG